MRSGTGYGLISRLLHWTMALLILATIPVGLAMTQEGLARPVADRLFIFHKGVGATLLLLILIRILWRIFNPPPPLPDAVPRPQRLAAAVVHVGLYATVATMAISGYVRVMSGGFPIELLNAIGIPPLLPKNEPLAEIAKTIHATAIWALIPLIGLHIAAALFHLIVKRDGVFQRMWPTRKRAGKPVTG